MSLLQVVNIEKRTQDAYWVKDFSFEQQEFQKIGIVGETGSGKSTLMKMIAGLVQPDSGAVYFKDKRVIGPDEQLIPGHKSIAYLSQHFELRNHYRVEELLSYANTLPEDAAADLYKVCRIDHLLARRTDQLSGGEKQRIALARLLIMAPQLLLLDEPYSNLDLGHKNILKSVIRDLSEQIGITCLLVSHDPYDILSWADHIIVMKDGHMVQQGTPQDIYHYPADEYTAGLFGPYDLVDFTKAPTLYSLLGEKPATGKRLFLRPEYVKLADPATPGIIPAVLQRVDFQGSFHELRILVEEQLITVRTGPTTLQAGERVHLRPVALGPWFL